MRKLFTLAIIGGVALGVVTAILLVNRSGPFCPICGGKLALEKESAVCTSCGMRLRFQKP
jgi:hypothetical protein